MCTFDKKLTTSRKKEELDYLISFGVKISYDPNGEWENSDDVWGTPCMMPFKHENITYNGCIKVEGHDGPQCPLGTDWDGGVTATDTATVNGYSDWYKCRTGCPLADE